MGGVFFHEDDYCQVEVLPASACGYCLTEMGRIEEFAKAHWDGAGFDDMYVRGQPAVSLASLGTSLAEWELALEPLSARFSQVLTGYGSHRESCSSIVGWGFSDSQALFASVGEGALVGPVWLSLNGVTAERVELWCRLLRSLPRAAELIVADWNSGQVVSLADEPGLADYLRGEPDAESGAAPDAAGGAGS